MTEAQLDQKRNTAVAWSDTDSARVRHLLDIEFDIPVSTERWPNTYAYDFLRNHGMYSGNRADASQIVDQVTEKWGTSREFVLCIFAMAYLVQDSLNLGYAMAVAIANSPSVREPWELVFDLGLGYELWMPKPRVQ